MKLSSRVVVFSIFCLVALTTAVAASLSPQPALTVAGVYENFTVGKGSGDLEGMRVVIVSAGGGYYAIVQIAQGGAEDPKPEFVEATVKGKTVSFSVGDQKFTGTATLAGLTVKDSDGQSHMLKRKACASYFK
jgi:hypothetical protein